MDKMSTRGRGVGSHEKNILPPRGDVPRYLHKPGVKWNDQEKEQNLQ